MSAVVVPTTKTCSPKLFLARNQVSCKIAQTVLPKRSFSCNAENNCSRSMTSHRLSFEEREFMRDIISKRVPWKSLHRDFYLSETVYKADIENVWKEAWLFAAFTFQFPQPGTWINFEVGDQSLIIIKGDDNVIRAFQNLCRHRGSVLVTKESGNSLKLVCPYHGWTYGRDGKLVKARWMEGVEGFNLDTHGLLPVPIREVGGLIFVSLSKDPPNFDEAYQSLYPEIRPHRFDTAKAAHVANYDIHANWKLVYENNRECGHCNIAHPEYIRANYDTAFSYCEVDGQKKRVVDPESPNKEEIEKYIEEQSKKWAALGLSCSPDSSFPGAGWYRASRTPNKKGWVTESIDGQPVSTIMGEFTDRDMGSCRVHTLPNFWIHASSDHAVATRLVPVNKQLTKAQVTWLVDKNAVEGKDYTLEKLLPFWKCTSEQDWLLCENNHKGIMNPEYEPGPFSLKKEAGVEKFISWYLKKVLMHL